MTHHCGKIVLLAVLVSGSACNRKNQLVGTSSDDPLVALRAGPALPADQVWELERTGPSPSDTTVSFSRRTGRRIVMRHGPPDNAIFAAFDFPADTSTRGGETIEITIRPMPGRYAFQLESNATLPAGAQGTFSYAMHFATPPAAQERYPTPTRFEQALSAAYQGPEGKVQFIAAIRPAIDIMRFPLVATGIYLLASPK